MYNKNITDNLANAYGCVFYTTSNYTIQRSRTRSDHGRLLSLQFSQYVDNHARLLARHSSRSSKSEMSETELIMRNQPMSRGRRNSLCEWSLSKVSFFFLHWASVFVDIALAIAVDTRQGREKLCKDNRWGPTLLAVGIDGCRVTLPYTT